MIDLRHYAIDFIGHAINRRFDVSFFRFFAIFFRRVLIRLRCCYQAMYAYWLMRKAPAPPQRRCYARIAVITPMLPSAPLLIIGACRADVTRRYADRYIVRKRSEEKRCSAAGGVRKSRCR